MYFYQKFSFFYRNGAYMAITLKLRLVLFNASDTFTWFMLSFSFGTKTSCFLQVSLLFVVSLLFSLVLFCIFFKSKILCICGISVSSSPWLFWIIGEIQLFVAIKGNFLVYSFSEQVAEEGNTLRDYLIHVTICLFAYS